jgi:hypothetical protein
MGWLDSFLHPEKGYQKGQEELQKYFQQAQQFQQPYQNNANQVAPGLLEAFQRLLSPGGLQDEWAKGYKESDLAKQLESEATDRGLSTAASQGLGGSSSALQAVQGGTQKIVNQERSQYLNDLMQKYLAGLGIGQNIYGVGANSANNSSNNALRMGENSANLEFGKQNAGGNLFSNLLGLVGGIGGSALAGPIGGSLAKRWNLAGG